MFNKDYNRKHYRVKTAGNLYAFVTIVKFRDRTIHTGQSPVDIINISPSGLRFKNALKFPINEDVILSFTIYMFGSILTPSGNIVYRSHLNNSFYEYGVKFTKKEGSLYSILVNNDINSLNLREQAD